MTSLVEAEEEEDSEEEDSEDGVFSICVMIRSRRFVTVELPLSAFDVSVDGRDEIKEKAKIPQESKKSMSNLLLPSSSAHIKIIWSITSTKHKSFILSYISSFTFTLKESSPETDIMLLSLIHI